MALRNVPLPKGQPVRITAFTPEGKVDESFQGPVEIEGLRITEFGKDVPPGEWENGSDLAAGRAVYVESSEIQIREAGETITRSVRPVWKWWSLLPPVVAIILAVWLKDVIIALLIAVFSGAVVLSGGDPFTGFLRTIDTHILRQIVPTDGEPSHAITLLFTLFLGAMVGVMAASGGTRALVNSLTRYTRTREHGQVMTWLMGLVMFFDDYANALLVGSTMRSVSDRLNLSREKLSFIVDSTAAPVAGLAIVSTWVGFELSQIQPAFTQLAIDDDVYFVFLATIPYRFYPLLLLAFGFALAFSGRDFGPMLRAEQELRPGLDVEISAASESENPSAGRWTIWNALLPLGTLLAGIITGLLLDIDSYPVLLWSSFGASLVAMLSAISFRSLPLTQATTAWIKGAESMLMALVILVLAWSIAGICDEQHLNTAGLVIDSLGDDLSARWMPAIAFFTAAVISFATGSSFATMGLLMSLFITVTYYLMLNIGIAAGEMTAHPFMLGTIGAILAGAIFGDHCSPISDTTVLSSAASGCDHLAHVATQLPYAMTVGLVSLGVGYVPIAWGVSPYVTLPVSLALILGILFGIGRRPGQTP